MNAKKPSKEQLENRIRWFQHQANMSFYDERKARVAEFKKRVIPLLEALDTEESRQEALEERMGLGLYMAHKHIARRTKAMAEEAFVQFDAVSERCYDRIYKKRDATPRHFGMFALARFEMAQIRNRQGEFEGARRLAEEGIELLLSGRWKSQHHLELLILGFCAGGDALCGLGASEMAALKNYEQALSYCQAFIESGLAVAGLIEDWEEDEREKEAWNKQEEDDCPWLAKAFNVEHVLRPVQRSIAKMTDSASEATRQFAKVLLNECDEWLVPIASEARTEAKEA